jgi:predicted nuclease of predicted toxin-antitoxin system
VADLYADEQFPQSVVEGLRSLGHTVLTVQEADNRGLSDEEVLSFAMATGRAVLTLNRRHFIRLHQVQPDHAGILVCRDDSNREKMARRISEEIALSELLIGKLIRVNRQP